MSAAKAATARRDLTAELAFLTRALKAPTLRESVSRLAERARAESWSHEEYLAACLQREVAARDAHGGESRARLLALSRSLKTTRHSCRRSLDKLYLPAVPLTSSALLVHRESESPPPPRPW